MYKIKDKFKLHLFKYAHTKLDINGVYTKEEWNKNGFNDRVLELDDTESIICLGCSQTWCECE